MCSTGEHRGAFCAETQQRMPGVSVQSVLDGFPFRDGVAFACSRTSPRSCPAVQVPWSATSWLSL